MERGAAEDLPGFMQYLAESLFLVVVLALAGRLRGVGAQVESRRWWFHRTNSI